MISWFMREEVRYVFQVRPSHNCWISAFLKTRGAVRIWSILFYIQSCGFYVPDIMSVVAGHLVGHCFLSVMVSGRKLSDSRSDQLCQPLDKLYDFVGFES